MTAVSWLNEGISKRGVTRQEWGVREDFLNNEAVLLRCSFDSGDQGHRVELEFEAVK